MSLRSFLEENCIDPKNAIYGFLSAIALFSFSYHFTLVIFDSAPLKSNTIISYSIQSIIILIFFLLTRYLVAESDKTTIYRATRDSMSKTRTKTNAENYFLTGLEFSEEDFCELTN